MWLLTLVFLDVYGRRTRREYRIEAVDYAGARVIADQVLVAAQNLTVGYVAQETLSEINQVAGAADAGSNIDTGMTIQFSLGGTKTASLSFPMPIAAAINSDGTVDLSQGDVAAFLGLFTGGDVTISDGEIAVSALKGVLDK